MSEHELPRGDRDSAPWWEALDRGTLLLQRCHDCGRYRWPAREICNACGSLRWDWHPASGRAQVVSWIVNHHQFSEHAHDPSTVVLARLAEQPDLLLPGWFSSIGDDPAEPRVGLEVEAQTSRDGEETRIIWRTPDGVGAE